MLNYIVQTHHIKYDAKDIYIIANKNKGQYGHKCSRLYWEVLWLDLSMGNLLKGTGDENISAIWIYNGET